MSGFGTGLVIAPFFDIALAGVTLPMVGSASGVLNASSSSGGTAGIAVLGTVFFELFDAGDSRARSTRCSGRRARWCW